MCEIQKNKTVVTLHIYHIIRIVLFVSCYSYRVIRIVLFVSYRVIRVVLFVSCYSYRVIRYARKIEHDSQYKQKE